MSVLINMEMPSSCFNCPMGISVNFGMVCSPTHTIISDDELFDADGRELERQAWCPLIEIPPHGRLIDADKLIELCNIMADKCDGIGESIWNQFATTVEWTPTVIPASEEDT